MGDNRGSMMLETAGPDSEREPVLLEGVSRAALRVALVCMPFASAARPSMQVGLVSAIAKQAGFETDSFYFNLDLAVLLSLDVYEKLCEQRGHMAGEWLFAPAAFGDLPYSEEDYFATFPEEAHWRL